MTQETTRRALFGAAGLVAVAAAVPVMANTAHLSASAAQVSPKLLALLAEHKAADATIDRFYAAVFNPAVDRETAMRAAIPHIARETAALSPSSHTIYWNTGDRHSIAHAAGIAKASKARSNQSEAWQQRRSDARSFYAAHLRRERALARVARDSGMDAAEAGESELYAPIKAARHAIYNYPVASLADVAAKLAFIESDNGMDGDDLLPLVIADVAQLVAREAH